MATLVTGGTGFVGANIVRELARAGHEVVSYDIAPADALVRQFIAEWEGSITFAQGDIRDREAVAALAQGHGIDGIIHAATYTVNQRALEVERGRDVVGINVEGLVNVLELARIAGVRRVVYVSSGAAYGLAAGTDQTYSEGMPVAPDSMYGITKYAGELITRRYGELYGFQSVSVRLSTPYGPMERVTGHRAVMCPPFTSGPGRWCAASRCRCRAIPLTRRTGAITPMSWIPPAGCRRFSTLRYCPTTCTT